MSNGIISYGAYVPRHRLQRAELGAALGAPSGKGARAVASYDEDATTMGFEAARRALPNGTRPESLYFATTAPPYMEKTNASAIHAALDIGHRGHAADMAGSPRSGVAALRTAAAGGGLAVLSDLRVGRAGSADEREGGDGAAAFLFGDPGSAIAEIVGQASATAEFLDRWRLPGSDATNRWEDRFGVEEYLPLIQDAAARALEAAGVDQPDLTIVSSPHSRAAAAAAGKLPGKAPETPPIGYAGAADAGLRLAAALDTAGPGTTILLVVGVDGADALVIRATDRIGDRRPRETVAGQAVEGRDVTYPTYLTWRGMLEREPPRRPEPDRPAGPPSARSEGWKFAFVGSSCEECGQVHVPPRRVCAGCGAVDRMQRRPLADRRGTVATFTVDRLAFSPAPPIIDAVIDFEGGGRYTLEVTDASPEEVGIGTDLELTFRRLYTVGGVHNYFWKARPVIDGAQREED